MPNLFDMLGKGGVIWIVLVVVLILLLVAYLAGRLDGSSRGGK